MLSSFLIFFILTAGDVESPNWGASFFENYKALSVDQKKLLEFWKREAKYLGLRETEWTIDPDTKCNHFITILPATIETQAPPLILIHRPEDRWGFLAGFIDWLSLKRLQDRRRSRDIFFIKSCGGEANSKYGTRDLVHYLIRSLPGVNDSWTSFQKLEAAAVWAKFPELRKIEMVISHSVPAFHFTGHAELYLPIVTATKGFWSGTIPENSPAIASSLNEKQKFFGDFWRSLHPEMAEFASVASATLPLWEQWLVWLRARLFFDFYPWSNLIENIWSENQKHTEIYYDFLGDREQREIEKEVASFLPENQKIVTTDYIPFRRSFIFSADSQMILKALREPGGIRPFTFIAPHFSDSSFFRWAGFSSFDVLPLRGNDPDKINWDELQKAIDIKFAILQKLIQ